MMKSCYSLMSVVAYALCFTACQKELCYDHNHDQAQSATLNVVFDWVGSPQANPTSMRFIAFRETPEEPMTVRDFNGRNGGQTTMGEGEYKAIGFNLNTTNILSRGSTWATYEMYTPLATPLMARSRTVRFAEGTEEQPTVLQPDMLWTGANNVITLVAGEEESITVPMQVAVYTYKIIIDSVENIRNISYLIAGLSGMSESMFPSTGIPSDTRAIFPFSMEAVDNTAIQGTVRTFGHCPDDMYQHLLTLYIQLLDNTEMTFTFDVTEQMHDVDHVIIDGTGRVEKPIVISGLTLPEPPTGMYWNTTIGDWNSGGIYEGIIN